MKYYDYPASVFVGMQGMIHNEKLLKNVRYVDGHNEQVAKEMSKTILRQPSRSPTRDTAYKCCFPISPASNPNPEEIPRAARESRILIASAGVETFERSDFSTARSRKIKRMLEEAEEDRRHFSNWERSQFVYKHTDDILQSIEANYGRGELLYWHTPEGTRMKRKIVLMNMLELDDPRRDRNLSYHTGKHPMIQENIRKAPNIESVL